MTTTSPFLSLGGLNSLCRNLFNSFPATWRTLPLGYPAKQPVRLMQNVGSLRHLLGQRSLRYLSHKREALPFVYEVYSQHSGISLVSRVTSETISLPSYRTSCVINSR